MLANTGYTEYFATSYWRVLAKLGILPFHSGEYWPYWVSHRLILVAVLGNFDGGYWQYWRCPVNWVLVILGTGIHWILGSAFATFAACACLASDHARVFVALRPAPWVSGRTSIALTKAVPCFALSRTCSPGMGLLCYLHLVRHVSLLEEVLHECEEAAGRVRRHEQVFAQPPRHRVRSFPQIPTFLLIRP